MEQEESFGCANTNIHTNEENISSMEMRMHMQKKKTFSTMEIILLVVVIGSLNLSFLQNWRDEKNR